MARAITSELGWRRRIALVIVTLVLSSIWTSQSYSEDLLRWSREAGWRVENGDKFPDVVEKALSDDAEFILRKGSEAWLHDRSNQLWRTLETNYRQEVRSIGGQCEHWPDSDSCLKLMWGHMWNLWANKFTGMFWSKVRSEQTNTTYARFFEGIERYQHDPSVEQIYREAESIDHQLDWLIRDCRAKTNVKRMNIYPEWFEAGDIVSKMACISLFMQRFGM